MGMFDNDKVFAPDGKLQDWANPEQVFILWNCWIQTEEFRPPNADRDIAMSHLEVSSVELPDKRETVSSLSMPIADKVRNKKDGDLPALVMWKTVPSDKGNDAVVLQFVGEYEPAKAKAKS